MAKISKRQAMFNTLVVNVVFAESDYREGKFTLETLLMIYRQNRMFAIQHLNDLYEKEWYKSHAVNRIQEIISETAVKSA